MNFIHKYVVMWLNIIQSFYFNFKSIFFILYPQNIDIKYSIKNYQQSKSQ